VDTTTIAETMERDIARLKAARPRLTRRIERAEHILVTQLSTANGSRPVKVRVHADGSRSFRVRSGSKLGRSYRVDQTSWECECSGCGGRFASRELTELTEDNHDYLTYFDGDLLCRTCADNAGVAY